MAAPVIQLTIYFPSLGQWRDVTAVADLGQSLEFTEAIEAPTETNVYVAPDMQIKLNEGISAEFLLSWFDTITPDAMDWEVELKLEGVPIFTGFILPNSLQIDDVERWAAFTAVGKAARLARTSADTATFKRSIINWTVVSSQGNAYIATVTVQTMSPQNSCDFTTDDKISVDLGGGQKVDMTVTTVKGTGTTPPYPSFVLGVVGMTAPPPQGAIVQLLTPYFRNIALKDAVNLLFTASGLSAPVGANYNVQPIANASSPFATRPNVRGLIGYPQSVIPELGNPAPRQYPLIGTASGTYAQYDPPLGNWALNPSYLQGRSSEPVDWTDDENFSSMSYALYGPRSEQLEISNTDYEYIFWHYWYVNSAPPPIAYRFGLSVTISIEPDNAGYYGVRTTLYKDQTLDSYTWTRVLSVPVGAGSLSTLINLHNEIGETVGIYSTGIRSSSGQLLFTHPDATNASGYSAATVSLADLTGYTNRGFVRGKVRRNGVFAVDTYRDNTPTAFIFTIAGDGAPLLNSTVGLPLGFQPQTLTYNTGDGFWYALSASMERGVELLSYTSNLLGTRAGYVPTQIEAQGNAAGNYDLTCISTATPAPGAWPMVALVNGNVWWIAYSFTGLIPYLDTEGLSCADVLAQLGVTVDAFFYVDAQVRSHFRSRPATAALSIASGTALTSTAIDDAGCLSLRRAAIWYKTVRHVTVSNEKDEAITGTAGIENFANTDQALSVASRYVTTTSFAQALAQNTYGYLGRGLILIDVEHIHDGRLYEVGRTFTATVRGMLKTFQIIDVTNRPAAGTVRVQGVEM